MPKTVLVVWLIFVYSTEASRILGVFPVPQYSHYTLGNRLMVALAEKGHDVTIITPFKEKNPPKFYREIFLEGAVEEDQERKKRFFHTLKNRSWFSMLIGMNAPGNDFTERALLNEGIQTLLKNPKESFDVVIVEQFFHDAFKGFAYHFNAPLIALSSTGSGPWLDGLLGNPVPRSYIPNFSLGYSPRMNFWQRLCNGLFSAVEGIKRKLFFLPKANKILQKHFPGSPTIEELNANITLMLLNSHVSSNQPVPRVPNMIEIGGFHVHPSKKLPEDLQRYLDEAKEGVIYFSMGSNILSKNFPEETVNIFTGAFSKVKMEVLWKFENDSLPGAPKNVKFGKWLPQQDILAHPNVKLFITQGGLLSTIETVYHGAPILGIPMAADQKMNMANSVYLGIGEILNYKDLSEENLLNKINMILGNEKYKRNVMQRSAIMKDRPMPPLETAVFWVEYVIRHKGAPHFKSAALDLTWFQYYMLDVIAFLITLFAVIFVSLRYAVSQILRRKNTKKSFKQKLN